ncbi:hypothetical protein [Amycolatopsis nigrescens]|uniref:hypothetical protein n=1 Tax=Amycolatopsis nigrescens TaxID=381445 RepID=UPI000363D2A7|nr:hypothetical protein [Amycolatopsis nigrescens]
MTGRPRSTTRRDLLRLRSALLMLTAIVLVTSLFAFTRAQATVRDAGARTAPAVLDVAAARSAVAQADNAAMAGFRTGQVQLVGPGERFQNQIAIAGQSLAAVAEHNAAGETGSRVLQVVQGQLASYTGWVGQADAHFRQSGATAIGVTDLWYAARLVHTADSGILAQLDTLDRLQREALARQLSGGWLAPWSASAWLVPIGLLLGLLVLTQVFLRKRFRRRVSPALVAASVLLILLATAASMVFVSDTQADTAGRTLDQVVTQWRAQTDQIAAEGRQSLAAVIRTQCGAPGQDTCGDTVDAFLAGLPPVAGDRPAVTGGLSGTKLVNEQLLVADRGGLLEYLMLLAALAVAALILLALHKRIDEYRYGAT